MSRPVEEIEAEYKRCRSEIMRSTPLYMGEWSYLMQREKQLEQELDQAKKEIGTISHNSAKQA